MTKYGKDIKVGDLIWCITKTQKPTLTALIVKEVKIEEFVLTRYLNICVQLPDGSIKYLHLLDNKNLNMRDYYNEPLLQRLYSTSNSYTDTDKNTYVYICYNKTKLYNTYKQNLENEIVNLEDTIKRAHESIVKITEQLNNVKKLHEIAE